MYWVLFALGPWKFARAFNMVWENAYNLDHAYPLQLLINVTKGDKPITLQFDACQVISCGDLNHKVQPQAYSVYMYPDTSLGVDGLSPSPTWNDVWWTTQ